MTGMDEEFVARLRAAAAEAFAGTPVKFAYLFGSRARGNARPDSDVDIAIYVNDSVDPDRRFDMALRLPSAIEPVTPRQVDMVVLNDMPLALRGRVAVGGVLIYSADDSARLGYESLTFREFCDYSIFVAPLVRKYFKDVAAGAR